MLTKNEKVVLRYLLVNLNKDASINKISKECKLSPNGAYKILKKFEKEEILIQKKIANLISFKLNLKETKTKKILELVFMDKLEGKIKYRYNDLKPLEKITSLCIIFGSYITKKDKPNDIDILFVIKKNNYTQYNLILDKVRIITPYKIHDVIQTKEDLIKNIKEESNLIYKILSEGIVLWGEDFLIEVIERCQ